MTKRNEELEEKIQELQGRLSRLSKRASGEWDERDLQEIVDRLTPIEIEVKFGKNLENVKRVPLLAMVEQFRDSLVRGVTNMAGTSYAESILFFNVFPKLAVYELAASEKVAGRTWRHYALTAKGRAFLAYLDKGREDETKLEKSKIEKPARKTKSKGNIKSKAEG